MTSQKPVYGKNARRYCAKFHTNVFPVCSATTLPLLKYATTSTIDKINDIYQSCDFCFYLIRHAEIF